MAKKKENLKDLSTGDLKEKLTSLQDSLRVLRFKVEGSKSKNVKEALTLKRQIARVLTALNQAKNNVGKK